MRHLPVLAEDDLRPVIDGYRGTYFFWTILAFEKWGKVIFVCNG